jgi:hypothetical protein
MADLAGGRTLFLAREREPAASTLPGHTLAVCRWHPLGEWLPGRREPFPYVPQGMAGGPALPGDPSSGIVPDWRTNSQQEGERRQRTWRYGVHGRGPHRGPARPGESLAGGCSPCRLTRKGSGGRVHRPGGASNVRLDRSPSQEVGVLADDARSVLTVEDGVDGCRKTAW